MKASELAFYLSPVILLGLSCRLQLTTASTNHGKESFLTSSRDNQQHAEPGKRAIALGHRYIGIGKRRNDRSVVGETDGGLAKRYPVDAAMRYAGVGKRPNIDSAMRYAGLGKRYYKDSAMRYAGIGKRPFRQENSAPGQFLEGVGKGSKEAAKRYAGVGKKMDASFRYAGIGKRHPDDPVVADTRSIPSGMKFMGIGKKNDHDLAAEEHKGEPATRKITGVGLKGEDKGHVLPGELKLNGSGNENKVVKEDKVTAPLAMKLAEIGKREHIDIKGRSIPNGMKYAGIGKREEIKQGNIELDARALPASMRFAGIGRRAFDLIKDAENSPILEGGKRAVSSSWKYVGIGKRGKRALRSVSEGWKFAGIGKRDFLKLDQRSMNPGWKFAGIGKRQNQLNQRSVATGWKFAGIGKRGGVSSGWKFAGIGKRGEEEVARRAVATSWKHTGIGKRTNSMDIEIDSRPMDAGWKFAGIGKRNGIPQKARGLNREEIKERLALITNHNNLGKELANWSDKAEVEHDGEDERGQLLGSEEEPNSVPTAIKTRVRRGYRSKLQRRREFDPMLFYMGIGK